MQCEICNDTNVAKQIRGSVVLLFHCPNCRKSMKQLESEWADVKRRLAAVEGVKS